jgi:hypothetical protein
VSVFVFVGMHACTDTKTHTHTHTHKFWTVPCNHLCLLGTSSLSPLQHTHTHFNLYECYLGMARPDVRYGYKESCITRVGQNRIYAPYMTVYLGSSLPKIPYIHRIYMVLANPMCYLNTKTEKKRKKKKNYAGSENHSPH